MQKRKRTDKSKYKHQSTGDHCTCAAYVAEIMCMRKAEHENKGSLPFKFWNIKPFDWTFKRQLYTANQLLKEYSDTALVKSINSQDMFGIFSLSHPKVMRIVEKYQILENEQKAKEPQKLEVHEKPKVRKKSFGKKSTLNKLRALDGEEEVGGGSERGGSSEG